MKNEYQRNGRKKVVPDFETTFSNALRNLSKNIIEA